jgi:hypothetical protein
MEGKKRDTLIASGENQGCLDSRGSYYTIFIHFQGLALYNYCAWE